MKKLLNLRGHSVFRPLSDNPVVVDLGGNHGDFSVLVAKQWNARVFAVEANPSLAANFPKDDRVQITHAAIAASDGVGDFSVADHSEWSSLGKKSESSVQVRTISLGTLLKESNLDFVDVVKVDIEGAEIDLFEQTEAETLQKVAQFTVEFHDHLAMPPSDRTPAKVVSSVVDRMNAIGFDLIKITHFGHGDVLFVNRKQYPISAVEIFWYRWVFKYVSGCQRYIKRVLGR